MFRKKQCRGHSTRWVVTDDGGWIKSCECGKVLARYPGDKEIHGGKK